MDKVYKIKPVNWVKYKLGYPFYEFGSIFGSMYVEFDDVDGWFWKYCFDEIYDEGKYRCSSKKECFEQAEKFYINRLVQALDEVENGGLAESG